MINGLFVQLMMFATAIGLAFFYVKPTLTSIGTIQDSILEYQTEKQKVTAVNDLLAGHVSTINEIPADSMRLLTTFIPDTVNDVAVVRDIYYIGEEAGVELGEIEFSGLDQQQASAAEGLLEKETGPYAYNFSVKAEGSYYDIKRLLSLFESNKYPLEVTELEFQNGEEGDLSANISLTTYAHTKPLTDLSANQF